MCSKFAFEEKCYSCRGMGSTAIRQYETSQLLTTCSGNPQAANSLLSSSIVFHVVVEDSSMISGHFECVYTTRTYIFPLKGPAKSTWILCHGWVGHSHGCNGATLGELLAAWQVVQDLLYILTPASMPGHHM